MASVVDVSAYSCLQLLYALLLSERNKPYQMLAIGSWNFEYRENNKQSLGESIFCKQKNSTEEALLKFHGVKVQCYEKNDNQNWEVVIKNVLDSENKAIINTDSYWCPWSRAYGSKHFLHSFLLTNMDNAYVTCLDPYMQVEQQYVHLSSVEDGFRSVSFIGQCQGDNPSKEVVLEGLHEDLVETSKTSMFGDLDGFAYRIRNENIKKECAGLSEQLYAVPLFAELKKIVMSRKSYSYMLKYVSDMYVDGKINATAKELYAVAGRWDEIRSRLIRIAMRSSPREQDSIANDMLMIITQEKSLLFELLDDVYEER